LYDRRLRPKDSNGKYETLYGTLRLCEKKIHEYSEPNDPNYGLWLNESLEDMAKYWMLPNAHAAKYVYFEEIDFNYYDDGKQDVYPQRNTVEEDLIEQSPIYGNNITANYSLYSKITGGIFLMFGYLYALSF